MKRRRRNWVSSNVFGIGVFLLLAGGVSSLLALFVYAVGTSGYLLETLTGPKNLNAIPSGNPYYRAAALVLGGLAVLGGALMVGAKVWDWTQAARKSAH